MDNFNFDLVNHISAIRLISEKMEFDWKEN